MVTPLPEAAWLHVLDELERDLERGSAASWTPPSGLGPLPPALAPRAQALLAAQQDAIRAVETEKARIAHELGALPRTSAARNPDPAYIDTVA